MLYLLPMVQLIHLRSLPLGDYAHDSENSEGGTERVALKPTNCRAVLEPFFFSPIGMQLSGIN